MSSSLVVDARRDALVSASAMSSPPILRAQQDALLRLCLQKSHAALPGDATSADATDQALKQASLAQPTRATRYSLPDSFPLAASPTATSPSLSPSLGSRKLPPHSPGGAKGAARVLTTSPALGSLARGAKAGFKKEGGISTPILELALERIDISDEKDTSAEDDAPLRGLASSGLASEGKASFQYHEDILEVVQGNGDYSSKLIAKVPFPKGSIVARIEGATKGMPKRYTSVQCGCNEHLELNSDLVFINHSCDPNVLMDVDGMQVRAIKDIAVGQELTFFYPSTEWEMQQPFTCWCQSDQCVGRVSGAKDLTVVQLSRYFLSEHIGEMVASSLKYASSL